MEEQVRLFLGMVDAKAMTSSFLAAELTWRDVSFQVPMSKAERKAAAATCGTGKAPMTHKVVLEKACGRLAPGSFTAIMGASGAGKTTLLNYLSNRKFYLHSVKHSGKVYLNGRDRGEVDFNEYVAYVMQDDVLIESMTVREILAFTAKLRLAPAKAQRRMEEVVEQLELTKILDSRVGGILSRGISGGERKRVAIAMEILTDPLILFLDEPTTGLDSYNAENVVTLCKHLAQLGKTVCCTIHQPNSYIFTSFQSLLILANRKVVYSGDVQGSVAYFERMGFPFTEHSNPAERIIDVLSDPENVAHFPSQEDDSPINSLPLPHHSATHRASFFTEFRLLTRRSYLNYIRNKMMLRFKVMGKVFFTLIFLTCFWQVGRKDTVQSVYDRCGFLAFFLTGTGFDAVSTIGAFYDEKSQYVREQANRTYSPLAYYLSKFVSELPIELAQTIIYNAIIYSGVGLSFDEARQILIFLLVSVIIFVNGKGWCSFLLFAFQRIETAASLMPLTLILQVLFGGFFINNSNVPKYLYELVYISIYKYCWSAAVINEFSTFSRSRCGAAPQCSPVNYYDIQLSLWENVIVAVSVTAAVHLLAFCVLYRLSKSFRS